jgi:hypothetical protein
MASLLGQACTCWRDVIAPHPARDVQAGPSPVREGRCGDCAYRHDSPERTALEGDTLPYNRDVTFYCHDGMPKTIAHVHPSGVVELPMGDDYQPVIRVGRAWQADGRPAIVCAGWAAEDRRYQATRGGGRNG